MAVANNNAVKYAALTDEHITDIAKNIELFVKDEEYWDKFCHHSKMKRGAKTFQTRRLVKPKVNADDVVARAEFVAPRPTKIVIETFSKTVANYGDKAIYSREDLQYNFDNTVNNITDVLKAIAVQKLDYIKGGEFIKSACVITYDTSMLKTLEKASIVLRKNEARRWDGKHWLVHVTPEEKAKLVAEVRALGNVCDHTKVLLDGREYDFDAYGDFIFSETTSPVLYKSDTVQYMVIMGKRGIDGNSPVDACKLEGESDIELINNGLGSGVLLDIDGNYTSDDNKQQGSVAINMDGLGAAISDDLCILNVEVTVDEIKASPLLENQKTGYVSKSGGEIEISLTGTTYTEFAVVGDRYDSTASKHYGLESTIVSIQVKAVSGKTLGSVTAASWTANYKLVSGGSDIDAEVLDIVKTAANYDTLLVRVPLNAYSFSVECNATAS